MNKTPIHSDMAPAVIGTYSQAIRSGNLVFLSGQIPLDPSTMEIVDGDFEARARKVFDNLRAVAEAAGGSLDQVVKLTIYLTDLGQFPSILEWRPKFFDQPYPAATCVVVDSMVRRELIMEIEAIAILD